MTEVLGAGLVIGGVTVFLSGCWQDAGPLAPAPADDQEHTALQSAIGCRIDVRSGSMACTPLETTLSSGMAGAQFGGQGRYILLESTNVWYAGEIFSADVTVRNLLEEALGTADGVGPDTAGIKVFFHREPTPTKGDLDASITFVENEGVAADGRATFTAPEQPFFRYGQVLTPGKVSLPRTWQWHVPAQVEEFDFVVYISAATASAMELVPGHHFDARTISTGDSHTCALTVGGRAYCWGNGATGRLGHEGAPTRQTTPLAVTDPAGDPVTFVSITAGGDGFMGGHTCALTTEGEAYCWGYGADGQLGNGMEGDRSRPTAVIGPDSGPVIFTALAAGGTHTCALTTAGKAYCWGSGEDGQLGDDLAGWGHRRSKPVPVADPDGGPVTFVSIAAGEAHTCALTTDGAVYCWGYGTDGQLGDGTFWGWADPPRSRPARVVDPVGGQVRFTAITAGVNHTCALTAAGKAYCWGSDFYGQLGDGGTESQSVPVAVSDPVGGPIRLTAISAGGYHTCALTTSGKIYCWGDSTNGKVGDGSMEWPPQPRRVPVAVVEPVGDPVRFASITAGIDHSCAVTTAGSAFCWGDNFYGQLGDGNIETRQAEPVAVTGAAGMYFADRDRRTARVGALASGIDVICRA